MTDFPEETATFEALAPKTSRIALASAGSFNFVPVAWAEIRSTSSTPMRGVGEGERHGPGRPPTLRVGRRDAVGVERRAVARDLGEDAGPARLRVRLRLEHGDARALAHHDPRATAREGAAGLLPLLGRRGAEEHEEDEAQRIDHRVGAAREHPVGATRADLAQRGADRLQRRRAGRRDRRHRAAEPEALARSRWPGVRGNCARASPRWTDPWPEPRPRRAPRRGARRRWCRPRPRARRGPRGGARPGPRRRRRRRADADPARSRRGRGRDGPRRRRRSCAGPRGRSPAPNSARSASHSASGTSPTAFVGGWCAPKRRRGADRRARPRAGAPTPPRGSSRRASRRRAR